MYSAKITSQKKNALKEILFF